MTATDLSPTAVQLFRDAAARVGIPEERIQAFACDAADPQVGQELLSGGSLNGYLNRPMKGPSPSTWPS